MANEDLTEAKAREILTESARKISEACARDIQSTLEKHGCALRYGMMIWSDGKVEPQMTIAPKQ